MAKTLSAGVIPARRTPDGWRLLVLRAFHNWDFPKGVVEPGEDPQAAAIRETAEETAITRLEFAFGDSYRDTMLHAGGKIARYYLAITDAERITLPISAELGRAEHDEWRWVDFTGAAALLPPRLQPILEWARNILGA